LRSGSGDRSGNETQYGSKKRLQTRVEVHQRYSLSPYAFTAWALDQAGLSGTERALDAGCGSGAWLFPLAERLSAHGGTVIGLDLSEGMLADIREEADRYPHVRLQAGDVQDLPYEDGTFDFVMANFMLYHVPDIDRALRELKRVLKPAGRLMAATNSEYSMRPLWDAHLACQRRAGIPEAIVAQSVPEFRFSLENGHGFLRPHFPWFETRLLHDALAFAEPEPLLDYYASGFMKYGDTGHEVCEEQWLRVYELMREHAETAINRDGRYVIPKTAGFFLAQK